MNLPRAAARGAFSSVAGAPAVHAQIKMVSWSLLLYNMFDETMVALQTCIHRSVHPSSWAYLGSLPSSAPGRRRCGAFSWRQLQT